MRSKVMENYKKSQKKTKKKLKKYSSVLNEGYRQTDDKIYIKKSYDCYLEDYDNNLYIDTAMGGGSFLLGHSQKIIKKAVKKQLNNGTLYTLPSFQTHRLGELLQIAIPNFDNFVFCSTGSEATMRAIRVARAYTSRKKIAIFSGGWHGSHDLLLIDDTYKKSESATQKILKSNGTLLEMLDNIILLPYNHKNAFAIIEDNKDDLAMVFIEPAQGSNPRDDVSDFLHSLRKITKQHNILLGFDEVITGFRVALGGGQEYYGIKADIATYGKSLGGGLPIAAVGGTKEVMKCITHGTKRSDKQVFMGGTFSANPLSIASSIAVMKHLIKHRDTIYPMLEQNGNYLKKSINEFCKKEQIKAQMIGINSILRLVFCNNHIKSRFDRDSHEIDSTKQTLFYTNMQNEGIHIASNRINFLSTQHKKEDIDKIIDIYKKNLILFKEKGDI